MPTNEVDTYDETNETPAYTTSPELRATYPEDRGEVMPTDDLNSLDDIHAVAAYNRTVMGLAADDPTIPTPGTDPLPEPGPGPEDNEALDAATGGALSNAAETGPAMLTEPLTGRRQDAPPTGVSGITGTESIGGGGGTEVDAEGNPVEDEGEEEVEQVASDYDPGEYTVNEVNEYIAAHPEESDAIYAAEEAGKARAGILG